MEEVTINYVDRAFRAILLGVLLINRFFPTDKRGFGLLAKVPGSSRRANCVVSREAELHVDTSDLRRPAGGQDQAARVLRAREEHEIRRQECAGNGQVSQNEPELPSCVIFLCDNILPGCIAAL